MKKSHPVKFWFGFQKIDNNDLIDEMTKISVSPDFQKARSEADIKSEFASGIDDYSNRISVRTAEEDYEKVKKLLTSFVDEKFFIFN